MSLPRAVKSFFLPAVLFFATSASAEVLINEIMYHPSSERIQDEYIELFNNGSTAVQLTGWKFTKGIEFVFPNVSITAHGYLVVAADVSAFKNKYPAVANVIGGWTGRLSDSHNTLHLDDAGGNRVDSVTYADDGDWAIRMRTPPSFGHRGWAWHTEADGLGKSIELINPNLPNDYGQNWAASVVANGTPGAVNSVLQTDMAPLILDVQHLPAIPRSVDTVLVTARLLDDSSANLSATLYWRLDGESSFSSQVMLDNGLHNDGASADGVFGATIPPQSNNAVVEFYIAAMDLNGHSRTWPAAAIETNGVSLGQAANVLYQVDDSTYGSDAPLYRLIMKDADRAELNQIGHGTWSTSGGESSSDAEMNGTFISTDGTGTDVRYTVGFRNRGHGSRNKQPNSYRVSFHADNPWKGVTAINLNGQYHAFPNLRRGDGAQIRFGRRELTARAGSREQCQPC